MQRNSPCTAFESSKLATGAYFSRSTWAKRQAGRSYGMVAAYGERTPPSRRTRTSVYTPVDSTRSIYCALTYISPSRRYLPLYYFSSTVRFLYLYMCVKSPGILTNVGHKIDSVASSPIACLQNRRCCVRDI